MGHWRRNGRKCEGDHALVTPVIDTTHEGEKIQCRSNSQCGLVPGEQRNKSFVCLHAQLGDDGVYRYDYRCNHWKVPEGSMCFCQKLVNGQVMHWQYASTADDGDDGTPAEAEAGAAGASAGAPTAYQFDSAAGSESHATALDA